MHKASFSLKTSVLTLLPINYFVILYCVLYIISPFLNYLIHHLNDKNYRLFVVLLFLLFCVYPTGVDFLSEIRGTQTVGLSSIGMYGSQWGYTIVNFCIMYIIGAYLRHGESKLNQWSKRRLLLVLFCCTLSLILWARVNDKIGYFTERSAWAYCNPLIVFESILIFLIFRDIHINSKVINKLAEGTFTVFLIHNYFLPYLRIGSYVTKSIFILCGHLLLSVLVIYLVCWFVHIGYHFMADPVFRKLSDFIHLPIIEVDSE